MTDEISSKLDILIRLQATALTADMDSIKSKINFLSQCGLTSTLIADILGTTTNHVSVELSKFKRARTKKRPTS